MKKIALRLYTAPFFLLQACNNEAKDSVEKADSTNEASIDKADSAGIYQADAESANFLVKAANGGMAEVKLGEIAAERGINSKVKEMGQLMVADHTAANNEVKKLAAARNVSLPATIGGDMQKHIEELAAKKGTDFDRAFINQMIRDHEETITLFKKATEQVNDADVRTFANNTLSKLQEHLDSFKVIQKTIK